MKTENMEQQMNTWIAFRNPCPSLKSEVHAFL